jgi:hypothetical protein
MSELITGSLATASGTEYVAASTTASGIYQFIINASNMFDDFSKELEVRVYYKPRSTSACGVAFYGTTSGPGSDAGMLVTPPLMSHNYWAATFLLVTGASTDFEWTVLDVSS